jgi:hypothetical protein
MLSFSLGFFTLLKEFSASIFLAGKKDEKTFQAETCYYHFYNYLFCRLYEMIYMNIHPAYIKEMEFQEKHEFFSCNTKER